MKASIIICTYTEQRFLDACEAVNSVLRQSYEPKEVIVAVDCNPALAARFGATLDKRIEVVLNSHARGLSHTRNAGVHAASGEIIAFLDDDAAMVDGWLDTIMAQFREDSVMGAGGKSVPFWLAKPPAWMSEELYWIVGSTYGGFHSRRAEVRNVHGSNMAFRREVFENAGLFTGHIGYRRNLVSGEETEFCLRVRQAIPGAKIIYEPRAVVQHNVPPSRLTWRYLVRRAYGEGAGKGYINLLHGKSLKTIGDERAYLAHLGRYAASQIGYTLTGKGKEGLLRVGAVAVAVAATGLGYGLTIAKGRLQNRRQKEPAQTYSTRPSKLEVGGEDA